MTLIGSENLQSRQDRRKKNHIFSVGFDRTYIWIQSVSDCDKQTGNDIPDADRNI